LDDKENSYINYLFIFAAIALIFQFNIEFDCLFFLISVEDDYKVAEELKRADAVVFTYACDEPTSLERLSTFWLPKLRKLEVSILLYYLVFMGVFVGFFFLGGGGWWWWVSVLHSKHPKIWKMFTSKQAESRLDYKIMRCIDLSPLAFLCFWVFSNCFP